jgi:hypothetical protein
MIDENLLNTLRFYFPNAFSRASGFAETQSARRVLERLTTIPRQPLSLTQFNQLLHLAHEAGISDGFFRYYFLEEPQAHPFPVTALIDAKPIFDSSSIISLDQLRLGLHRFFVDALLYWGDFRTAFRALRTLPCSEIVDFFLGKRMDTVRMKGRGPILPFESIPADDRYLIAELACKAYSPRKGTTESLLEEELIKAYRACGERQVPVRKLIALAETANEADLQAQYSFMFSCDEFLDSVIESDDELREKIRDVAQRFAKARSKALQNTEYYLSIVNELDVYVATSMRNRQDFREMSRNCTTIFNEEKLKPFRLRYFDPTNSAAESHEDKGLIECLMVKCAKALIYFAGEKESFGKDAEAAMGLSLGKPVIIYCPSTPEGEKRMRFFRDIHPLSRLIDVSSGVAVGAMITNKLENVVELLTCPPFLVQG